MSHTPFDQAKPSDICVFAYVTMFNFMLLQKCSNLSVVQLPSPDDFLFLATTLATLFISNTDWYNTSWSITWTANSCNTCQLVPFQPKPTKTCTYLTFTESIAATSSIITNSFPHTKMSNWAQSWTRAKENKIHGLP